MLWVARRSAVKARTQAANQIHALVTTAPEHLKRQLRGKKLKARVRVCARWRPGEEQTTAAYAKMALRHLARRYQALDTEIAQLEAEIRRLCAKANPALLAAKGVGPDTAAALLVAAGDNPGADEIGEVLRCAMWHQPRPGVIRPDHPASSQPGRQPASQQRAQADRYHPDAHRRRHQRLRHPTQGRGQEEKGDHPLPQAAHRPTDLPTADQPAPNPELRPATHPTPTRRHHRDPGRPSSQHPPQPHLSTRTRPTPQPPPRYQIPELAPNPPSRPIPDLTNIGASNSSTTTTTEAATTPVYQSVTGSKPGTTPAGFIPRSEISHRTNGRTTTTITRPHRPSVQHTGELHSGASGPGMLAYGSVDPSTRVALEAFLVAAAYPGLENHLTEAKEVRGDLNTLVIGDEFESLLERQDAGMGSDGRCRRKRRRARWSVSSHGRC